MRKFILLTLCSIIVCSSACQQVTTNDHYEYCDEEYYAYEEGYEQGYEEGYDLGLELGREQGYEIGYDEAYIDGMLECQERLTDEFIDIKLGFNNPYGCPEEAVVILTDYCNGKNVTEQELKQAILIIRQYYDESYNKINYDDSYIW